MGLFAGRYSFTNHNKIEPLSREMESCTSNSATTTSNSDTVSLDASSNPLPLKPFHLFPLLPLELRHLIYHFATSPQLIYSSQSRDWINASLIPTDGYALRSPDVAIDLDSWKENEKQATAYSTHYTSLYCRLNPLLCVSKESRQHVIEREGIYGFNRTLSTREEWHWDEWGREDERHKYMVRVWESEDQEWKALQKMTNTALGDTTLTLSTFWQDTYWNSHILPTICLNKAIFVVTMRHLMHLYCAAPPMAERIRSIAITYWDWKLMIDDWYGEQAMFEKVLIKYTSQREIIFVYDFQQNVYEMPLPPSWKSVEDVIGEGTRELKRKYKKWTVPIFWAARRNMRGMLIQWFVISFAFDSVQVFALNVKFWATSAETEGTKLRVEYRNS
ncbi:hypothetical protein DL98DRAFT_604292 [Cadophora sp. DSE1049]|nr:hypothetical protein DL98DRAFT_604292 [Cadophora sp. DSE1049]